jgi:hypothetical protein
MVEQEQRVHFSGIQDDPVKMWQALEAVHHQKKPGMHFNAYDDLFSIWKLEEEPLQSLINRVEDCKKRIKELRPPNFTLEMLDDELASMALIRALPDDYSAFSSSLLLMDKLDKSTIHQAFVTEDIQCKKHAGNALGSSQALAARSGSQNASDTCDFCGRTGHKVATCWSFEKAKKRAQEDAQKPRKPRNQANKAQDSSSNDATTSTLTPGSEKAQSVISS